MLSHENITVTVINCADCLKDKYPELSAVLIEFTPSKEEFWTGAWRLRFEGVVSALRALNVIDNESLEPLMSLAGLKPLSNQTGDKRPGRDHSFSIDILTETGAEFSFNVAAMNPSDAYFQLTKRFAYKAIPDITAAEVYTGVQEGRAQEAEPVKTFESDELVFVSLI